MYREKPWNANENGKHFFLGSRGLLALDILSADGVRPGQLADCF